jgi:hypothetical protein
MKRFAYAVLVLAGLAAAFLAYRQFVLLPPLKAQVLRQLTDPDSAQWRDLHYYGDWTPSGGLLCGEVNAKNAMGGYAGYRTFIVDTKQVKVDNDTSFSKYCGELRAGAPWWWIRW